jgi:HK97 gp10 family phage protein
MFQRVQQVLMNAAIRVAERARELVPVRTGHLLASIRAEIGDMEEEASPAFDPIEVVAETPYASFVEFGTSKMGAQPYLAPAVEEIEPEILEEVDTILAELGLTPGVTTE